MNCPAESHKIEEIEKKEKYQTKRQPGLREYGAGVKILKAVRLYSSNEKGEKDSTKMKLEELLGQTLSRSGFVDSAWGCDSDHCGCEKVTKSETKHETYRGDICTCDKVKCSCDNVCRCQNHCSCDNTPGY